MVNTNITREEFNVSIPIETDFITLTKDVPQTFRFYNYDYEKVTITTKSGNEIPATRVRLWTKEANNQITQKFVSFIAKKAIETINGLIRSGDLLTQKIQITKTGEGVNTKYTFLVLY